MDIPQIFNSAQAMPRRRVRLALVGPTRSGKTTIVTSFPRPFFIFPANEGGEKTIQGLGFPFVLVNNRADVLNIAQYLFMLQQQGRLHELCETVALESASHLSEIVEDELTNGGQTDMKKHWGAYVGFWKQLKTFLFKLDTHLVISMLPKLKTDKNNEVVEHGPQLYGQSGANLISSCDAIGYTEVTQLSDKLPPQYSTHFCRYKGFPAGTRLRGMGPGPFPNFNFQEHLAPYL